MFGTETIGNTGIHGAFFQACRKNGKHGWEYFKKLGHSSREVELARIAGYLHDIGNAVNRENHAHIGAYMAYDILTKMGMGYDEAGEIMQAIGNHDESSGTAVSNVSAALILADKSDVHRSRVTNSDITTFDIHDRVNYAVVKSGLIVDADKKLRRFNWTLIL